MQLPFRAVIFDMDGTLFGTEQLAVDALRSAFGEHGIEVTTAELEMVIGRAGDETRAYLSRFAPATVGIDPILERGRQLITARIAAEGLPVKAGVAELLPYLRAQDVAVGLATTTRTATALSNLRRAHLDAYFGAVIGGDQVARAKPRPDIYLRALDALAVGAADAIAVEDSDLGIQAASAAGLRVIYVPDIKRIEAPARALVHREYPTLRALHLELTGGGQATGS
jgi:HAD superfamily hydrolase (TIGR01509 family)